MRIAVRFLAEAGILSVSYRIQTRNRTHLVSYPMGNGIKAATARSLTIHLHLVGRLVLDGIHTTIRGYVVFTFLLSKHSNRVSMTGSKPNLSEKLSQFIICFIHSFDVILPIELRWLLNTSRTPGECLEGGNNSLFEVTISDLVWFNRHKPR